MKLVPVLSVGIIFKNEIRCLERCLKSIIPLKKLLPCEIVMADTGATDGSREIAEKYADIVFDFPWINDFSAARNAVMDRCSGKWHFTIDCDEWLTGDLSRIAAFALTDNKYDFATIISHNYNTKELDESGQYSEFVALRFLRASTGLRYTGAVHESWPLSGDNTAFCFPNVILHHDGYVAEVWTQGNKEERNLALLEEEWEKNPHNLRTHMEIIDSCSVVRKKITVTERALDELREKPAGWQIYGPPILRHGVGLAALRELPEAMEWIDWAETWFPDSMYTQVDVNFYACGTCWNKTDYPRCIRHGEGYLQAIARYRAKDYNLSDSFVSTIRCVTPNLEQEILLNVAGAYARIGQSEKALEYAERVDGTKLDVEWTGKALWHFEWLHAHTSLDVQPLIVRLWKEIQKPKPSKEQAAKRREQFVKAAKRSFSALRLKEDDSGAERRGCLALRALKGEHWMGDAADLLSLSDPKKLQKLLLSMEDWRKIPATVLEHAILCGIRFPLPGRMLEVERLQVIAKNMTEEALDFPVLVKRAAEAADAPDTLTWAQAMTAAAVQRQNWGDTEAALELCRLFAQVEERFLETYYAQPMLTRENIPLLPPMHRFGWYIGRAFRAKEEGDLTRYISLLREGLQSDPEMKKMVQFLLEQVKQAERKAKIASAPPELIELAETVKGVLKQYDADDPAMQELKNSPFYQKVAWLLEEPAKASVNWQPLQ